MLFAGIDWASDHHDVAVVDAQGREVLRSRVEHSGEGLDALGRQLGGLCEVPGEIAVGVEMHQGPLVLWLLERGYRVYGINPRMAERARGRLSASGAKDDKRDALSLAEFVRTSQGRLRALHPDDPSVSVLRYYVRLREDLVQERTAHKQRLSAHLQQYSPQIAAVLGPFRSRWSKDLLLEFPTMARLQQAKRTRIRALLRRARVSSETEQALLEALKRPPIPVPPYLDAPHALEVQHRVRAIVQLDEAIEDVERTLRDLLSGHPDANIFQSLPCTGAATIAAIWSGLSSGVLACRDANELASRWGATPVTLQSGRTKAVRKRRAFDHTQMQYLLWFAFSTIRREGCWAGEYYRHRRAEGYGHYGALRALGRRWIRILWAMFTRKVPYDESLVRRSDHVPAPA